MGSNCYLKGLSFFDFETKKGPELANRTLLDANNSFRCKLFCYMEIFIGVQFQDYQDPHSIDQGLHLVWRTKTQFSFGFREIIESFT